ncbi:MAG: YbaK/EbsC family protein [Liquorilactobacillus ghanensis]|uniref:YbaK/EbsC family protein n=1 Tax=Liquorilactobacillus ghanensis TaxID=399370 RepID=UPI0039EB4416
MSLENVRSFFKQYQLENRIHVFDESTATVAEAAAVLEVKPEQIAKTLAFSLKERPIVIVTEGTAKISNPKYKAAFKQRAHMVKADELEDLIGHPLGGVCPFALKPAVDVYLDESLKKHDIIYPAAGTANAAVKLTVAELEKYAQPVAWVDVIKE